MNKRTSRARAIAERRESALIAARCRVTPDESRRRVSAPSRINDALAGVTGAVNAALQTEDAWAQLWAEEDEGP